ncbi:MAG: N(G),N(G)-dimethylarginine dimethylaminohydrolase [Anaerolineae bacterium]|jgi:dimethylargininase|nr:N(G),N(G)-dimethylarginine dimethylaminohydrolase [Anaerolineae bacterium]MBT7191414.1 N(G),N(G)-dimethylarginine dimethylaminohydrolase [Anaerolineae bacterium]MBT7989074.1 N(G),N(G)-dimethylarginine dimethylaminohydrolase [Anaerolineae bacterium]
MFIKAIVRKPGKSLVNGLSSADLGIPNYKKALAQHAEYTKALESCGLEVVVMEEVEEYPDSTFIEDAALLTADCAIITNPGAPSRKGEIANVKTILGRYYVNIEEVSAPGTVEGGDIMMVGSHFYIGLSERTNLNGANQVITILEKYGMSGSVIELKKVLHLKTGISYLEENNLVASGEFLKKEELQSFNILEIDGDESYAANCIWVNNKVLIPKGYPKAKNTIESAGYSTIEIDVSEFQKLDGGLSCLSLRF